MKKLNVAVVGLGNMGKHHTRNYAEIEQAALVAVCDTNYKLAQELAEKYHCNAYNSLEDLLTNEHLDAITIAAPTIYHHTLAKEIIQKGIHLLIEKPIADTPKKAEELIKLAFQKNIILTVGHIERFNPAILKLKEIVTSHKLGKISSIVTRRLSPLPPQIKDANVMIDLAVHDIDICSYILNKQPLKVSGALGKTLLKDREDFAHILLDYGNQSCLIEVNWITPLKIRTLSITGSKGYAELDYIKQEIFLYENNYTEKISIPIEKKEPLKTEILHFIDCVKNQKTPIVTGKMGRDALDIALKFIK
jgi:UDP-N-acetylglucosamine 3-dehydrogenase